MPYFLSFILIGTLVMLIGGYLGEAGYVGTWPGFIVGMLGWFYILREIFVGEAGKISASEAPASVQSAYKTMRIIVLAGWAIYPLGYMVGTGEGQWYEFLNGALDMDVVYNIGDAINKIGFGLVIYALAVKDSNS